MSEKHAITDLLRQAASLLPESAAGIRSEFEKNLRPVVESALARFDLVTRQEFDAQLALLQRLQQRTSELEAQLEVLRAEQAQRD